MLQAMRHEKPTTIIIGVRPQMENQNQNLNQNQNYQNSSNPQALTTSSLWGSKDPAPHHIPATYSIHRVPAVHMCASVPKRTTRLTTATTTRPSTTHHIQQRTAFTGCLQCTSML